LGFRFRSILYFFRGFAFQAVVFFFIAVTPVPD